MKKTDIEIPSVEEEKALDLYQGNRIKTLVKQVCDEVNSLVLDPANPDDYKAFGTVQRKISSFKAALDAAGKKLVDPLKKQAKAIDDERKYVKDTLDRLRRDFLAPREALDAEKERKEKEVADTIEWLNRGHLDLGGPGTTEEHFDEALARAKETQIDEADFGERTAEARKARDTAIYLIETRRDQWLEERKLIEAGRQAIQGGATGPSAPASPPESCDRPKATEEQAVVHRAILADLVKFGLSEPQAKTVIRAVYDGKIPHLRIHYK